MTKEAPRWRFWHPLSFWKVLLILFLAQPVGILPVVAIREGLGIPVPIAIGSGLAGLIGWMAIFALANKKRREEDAR